VTSGEFPQGNFEASRRATKTRSKISAEAEAELEGEVAKSDPVSPTRRPRDNLGVPIDSESKFFDNRKAGKSTPITLDPIKVGRGAMVWITYKFARVEQNCGRKGGLFKPQWRVTSGEWRVARREKPERDSRRVADR
jgi:hypothetical protein